MNIGHLFLFLMVLAPATYASAESELGQKVTAINAKYDETTDKVKALRESVRNCSYLSAGGRNICLGNVMDQIDDVTGSLNAIKFKLAELNSVAENQTMSLNQLAQTLLETFSTRPVALSKKANERITLETVLSTELLFLRTAVANEWTVRAVDHVSTTSYGKSVQADKILDFTVNTKEILIEGQRITISALNKSYGAIVIEAENGKRQVKIRQLDDHGNEYQVKAIDVSGLE